MVLPVFHILFAFLAALLVISLLSLSSRREYPWGGGLLLIFLLIFLVAWAGGVWITPFGPAFYGVAWMPYLAIALLFALLLAGLPVEPKPMMRGGGGAVRESLDAEEAVGVVFGIFMWIFVIMLLGALLLYYVWPPVAR